MVRKKSQLEHLAEDTDTLLTRLYREALYEETLGAGLAKVQGLDLDSAGAGGDALEQELVLTGSL